MQAEKRACFKSLPDILAFNTMRYSFNMVTMMKEKVNVNFNFINFIINFIAIIIIHIKPIIQVNTHFSFPFQLDMSAYMEHTLIPGKAQQAPAASPIYELIGKTIIIVIIIISIIIVIVIIISVIIIIIITGPYTLPIFELTLINILIMIMIITIFN